MRIVVNDFAASNGGGASILKSFYSYLVESKDENEWIFLLSDNYIEETENIKIILLPKEKKSRIRRLAFDLCYGRRLIKKLRPDAIFYLQNTLIRGVKCPQIMYMDQSIAFQKEKNFSIFKAEERKYAVYQHIIGRFNRSACKKSDKVIVQTKWLQEAIVKQSKKREEDVIRVPVAVNIDKNIYKATNVSTNTFFYPASGAVYKNHDCIYKAIETLDRSDFKMLLTLQAGEKKHKNCEYLGTVAQKEVYKIMSESVLLFPSYIESFGLPLKEAREIGTLIIAADTAFARELLEGYENAYYFNTFDFSELAKLMQDVLDGKIKHIPQGLVKNEEFNENSWKAVCEVIQEVCYE